MKRFSIFVFLVLVANLILTACQGVSEASCAYLVGDGYPDSIVDEVYYPGQTIPEAGTDHVIRYVPCGDRNYLITDGSKVSNGIPVGDETTLLKGKTSSGTDIQIALSAYFQLNQNEEAMKAFYKYQYKFGAASDTDKAGGELNNSTPEWLDMLGETFGPALARTAREGAFLTTDAIWQNGDVAQMKILQDYIVNNLQAKLRTPTGYNNLDFFCGANASGWPNPDKPGEGEFYCAPIEIEIDYVIKDPNQTNASTEGSAELAKQRLQIARELYGDKAECVLALLDIVAEANKGGGNVILNFSADICTSSNQSPDNPPILLPYPTNTAMPATEAPVETVAP